MLLERPVGQAGMGPPARRTTWAAEHEAEVRPEDRLAWVEPGVLNLDLTNALAPRESLQDRRP